MSLRKRLSGAAVGLCVLGAALCAPTSPALSQENLRIAWPYEVTSLDPSGTGVIRSTWGLAWHLYDRLFTFDVRDIGGGAFHYDDTRLKGELAESWAFSEDGKTLTIDLKQATFHDGSKVTAEDVVWSLTRAMSLKTSAGVMKAGGLTDPDQLAVVDEDTLTITFPERNRLVLPLLTVPMANIMNADLAKRHATADDPWATDWLKSNAAGGGAYSVERFRNEQVVLQRFDDWKSGPLPAYEKVVFVAIPEASTRGALVERDSADVAIAIPPGDLDAIKNRGDAQVIAIPMENQIEFIGFNSQKPPFDNPKVRQAIAYAIPYQDLFDSIYFGRGNPLFGASGNATRMKFPQAHGYSYDPEKARQLLAEAGFPNGFDFELSYCTCKSDYFEPMAVAIKDSLGKIGINAIIAKKPAAQFDETLVDKSYEVMLNNVISWLTSPDYWFNVFYSGDHRSNYGSYKSAEMEALLTEAKTAPTEDAYVAANLKMIDLALNDVPLLFIRNGAFEIAMDQEMSAYTYWFHSLPDARYIR